MKNMIFVHQNLFYLFLQINSSYVTTGSFENHKEEIMYNYKCYWK